jgi:hypothetical protein
VHENEDSRSEIAAEISQSESRFAGNDEPGMAVAIPGSSPNDSKGSGFEVLSSEKRQNGLCYSNSGVLVR